MEIKDVCGVPMGGLPGETPSLLIGSMFYDRQKIVMDATRGIFDQEAAKELLDLQRQWSEITGNPAGLDVIASTPEAMCHYLDFVIEHFEGPILVDGTDADVKIAGIEYLAANGQMQRTIYNSISPETRPREFEAISNYGVTSAVLLAMDPTDLSALGKLNLLRKEDGLLAKAKSCGVENFLVDPGVIDLPSVGTIKEVIHGIKYLGCFVGAAPHNAIGTWSGLISKLGTRFKPAAIAVLNAMPIAWGGDYVIYGPMRLAPTVFPAIAMVDVTLSQSLIDLGKIPVFNHPMFKIV